MAVHALSDEAAGACLIDLVVVVAPMLVDPELSGFALVALTLAVLVQIAANRHRSAGLHESHLAAVVHSDLPGLVLAELDTSSTERAQRMISVVAPWLRRRQPFADDLRLAALKLDHEAQVVPLVSLVVIRSAVQIHPLDVDDIEFARVAVDLVSLAPHGGDDLMSQIRHMVLRFRCGSTTVDRYSFEDLTISAAGPLPSVKVPATEAEARFLASTFQTCRARPRPRAPGKSAWQRG